MTRGGNRTRAAVAAAMTAGFTTMMAVLTGAMVACGKDGGKTAFESNSPRPDVLPQILNSNLPFRYPPALYAEKAQGDVTLRLFVDKDGSVATDSTRVVISSTVPLLDSAAVRGARELKFVPAKLHGTPMAVSIIFPVYFRHPEAPPPPGDTILNKVPLDSGKPAPTAADSAKASSAKAGTKPAAKQNAKQK